MKNLKIAKKNKKTVDFYKNFIYNKNVMERDKTLTNITGSVTFSKKCFEEENYEIGPNAIRANFIVDFLL